MKRTGPLAIVLSLFIIATLACGTSAPAMPDPATPDVQATVDAAVAATAAVTPTPNVQATVDAAVAATAAAGANAEATVVAAVQATTAAAPTPTSSAEYVAMTEEELAALIDEAVAEATAATQASVTATTQAVSDDTVTQEEVYAVEPYVVYADETIAYAEELIYAYYDLYGELALETIYLLQAVEEDLAAMADSTAAIAASLEEINSSLEAGLVLAEETISQLETAAQTALTYSLEAQEQHQAWAQSAQTQFEDRVAAALAVQPSQIPADLPSTLLSAFEYVDTVRSAVGDSLVSDLELETIAQIGANAGAGFQAHGGPQLQQLSGSIETITGQLARGEVSQAGASLGDFETALGARPSDTSRPSISAPSLPSAPSIPSKPSLPSAPSAPSLPARR